MNETTKAFEAGFRAYREAFDHYDDSDDTVENSLAWRMAEYIKDNPDTQAKTIERLADALEFALAYADTTDQAQPNWQKYTAKRWPNGLNVGQLHDALTSARALLAEIRGTK